MTHFWPTRRQQAVEYQEQGIEGAALEALVKETAPARHAGRVEFARRAAVQFMAAAFGRQPETLDPLESRLYAAALAHLDSFGPGGRLGMAGAATVRHPAFRGCGKGRKAASDGEAWSAAIVDLARSEWVEFSVVNCGGLVRAETVDQGDGTWSMLVDGAIAPLEWRVSLAREGLRRAAGLEGWFPATSMVAGTETLADWARVVNALEAEAEPHAEPQEAHAEPQEAPGGPERVASPVLSPEAAAAQAQPRGRTQTAVRDRIRQAWAIRITAADLEASGVDPATARQTALDLVTRGEGRWVTPGEEISVNVSSLEGCHDRWRVAQAAFEARGEACLEYRSAGIFIGAADAAAPLAGPPVGFEAIQERIRAARTIRITMRDVSDAHVRMDAAREAASAMLRRGEARWIDPDCEIEVLVEALDGCADRWNVAVAAYEDRGDDCLDVRTQAQKAGGPVGAEDAALDERIQAAGAVRLSWADIDAKLNQEVSRRVLQDWLKDGVARSVDCTNERPVAAAVPTATLTAPGNDTWMAAARQAVRARGDAALISRAEWQSRLAAEVASHSRTEGGVA